MRHFAKVLWRWLVTPVVLRAEYDDCGGWGMGGAVQSTNDTQEDHT